MTLGEKLTALRIRKGWSQEEFCEAFNRRYPELAIKRSRYSKWETGENQLKIEQLKAVVAFYRITADELLFDHKKVEQLQLNKVANRRLKIALQHPEKPVI